MHFANTNVVFFNETPALASDSGVQENGILGVAANAVSSDVTYYDVGDAAEYLCGQMTEREEEITVTISFSGDLTDQSNAYAEEIYETALEDSDEPDAGDYLKYHVSSYSYSVNVTYSFEESKYTFRILDTTFTITYTISYTSTAEQEQAVDEAVDTLFDELALDGMNTLQKVETIYDWVCSNVGYDYDHADDSDYLQKYTAYSALVERSTVCEGYTLLLHRLLKEAGLSCRVMTGTMLRSDGSIKNHAWNLVEVGGLYYYLDATWDAGAETYSYLLAGSSDFTDHTADEAFAEFASLYPISENSYYADAEEEETVYTITYVMNGGTNSASNPDSYTKLTGKIVLADPTRSGYTFSGWYSDEEFKTQVLSIASGSTGDVTLYAKWTEVTVATPVLDSLSLTTAGGIKTRMKTAVTANGYEYVIAKNKDFTSSMSAYLSTSTSYTFTGLTYGNTYYVKVRAYRLDSTGEKIYGSYSSCVSTTVKLNAPTVGIASMVLKGKNSSKNSMTLKLSGTVSNAYGYEYQIATNKKFTKNVSTYTSTATSKKITGLTYGKKYYVRVRAYFLTSSGTKMYGAYSSKKKVELVPGVPTWSDIKQTAAKKITVNVKDTLGAVGYEYVIATNKGFTENTKTYTTTSSSQVFSGLSYGETYYMKVRAYYKKKNGKKAYGDYSIRAVVTMKPAAASFKIVKDVAIKSLQVTVNAAKGADGYQIRYSTSPSFVTYETCKTTSLTKTITGLTKGKTYYIKVRAYTKAPYGDTLYSDFSKTVKVKIYR